jgi:hypothetical protein
VYTSGGVCEPNTCPAPCATTEPAQTGDFVYYDADGTCPMANNYFNTCLGSYDSGPEEIFGWTVPAGGGTYSVTLNSLSTYGGVAVSNDCEATDCVAFANCGSGYTCTIPFQFYAEGTYFIFVDNYAPAPDCLVEFTLTVAVPPLTGACCYDNGMSCSDFTESECAAVSGTYYPGEICANITCPTPCPFPNMDVEPNGTCAEAQEVLCNNSYCGEVLDAADQDWYKIVIAEENCQALTVNVYADDTQGHWPYGLGCDPWAGIYAADCATLIASNEDVSGSNYDSKFVTGCLTAGIYYIKVSTNYDAGPYVLDIACTPCSCCAPEDVPWNDVCSAVNQAGCDPVGPGVVMTASGRTNCALANDCIPSVALVFECFTLTECGTITVDYCGSDAGTTGNVYTALLLDCDCISYVSASSTDWYACVGGPTLTYSNLAAGTYYIPIHPSRGPNYTVTVTYIGECDCPVPFDYLANPIIIDVQSSTYTETVNTCCATDPIPLIGGYDSGPDVIFRSCGEGEITFTASGLGDNQLIVFDLDGNILGYADNGVGGDDETLTLVINVSCWYVSVSDYNGCGDITLTIEADMWLPVELTSFDAIAGDRAVTLNWATSSETNNDYYRIFRNGASVGEVNAKNAVTGGAYSYTDNGLTNGTSYDYSVVAVSMSAEIEEVFTISATPSFSAATISEYALHQNFPNPFNPETKITFDLVDGGFVNLAIYNLLGQQVSTLVNANMEAGRHVVNFEANNLPSGLYLYRMDVNGFSAQKKMVLMK